MQQVPAETGNDPVGIEHFGAIVGRNTADNLLRTAQQHHVQLSTMADMKANILITVSSIVLTLSLRELATPEFKYAAWVLAGFTLAALFLAVLAVLPKYRPLRLASSEAPLPNAFNVLFFGHFAELDQDRFQREIAQRMRNDAAVYAAQSHDLYSLGVYLARHKYRYLRLSYLFFLSGFVAALLVKALMWAGA
ncbi:MAG: hypothetical protein IT475_17385 [Aquimonas sp.]|jgi:hypothetical protein|nr:hypothetical protein [Xanthomonadales bacterium]MCC6507205.1 hypothetical protein [Aquimonas sp.]